MRTMGVVDGLANAVGSLPSPLDEPMVLLVVLVLLGILVWATTQLFRYLTRPPGKRFTELLAELDSAAVLMHGNPDPDAMASALATKDIAVEYDVDVSMYYPGQIRHHENRAFETVLDVEFDRIERAAQLEDEPVILVDHNEAREFPNADTVTPVAVVDHHPGPGTGSEFTDVRTDYGACASIFAEYLADLGWTIADPEAADTNGDDDRVLSPDTATGLVYGIQSDTKNLTSGSTAADFRAVEFLYDGIDRDKLDRIANPDMDPESLDIKARAITERKVRSAFAVSDVGSISNLDAIPQAADELRRLEGVTAVVVFGDKDGVIRLSGRSSDDRVHMGKVLEAAVDDIPMAGAGGHARMGGGTVPIEHMEGLGPSDGLTRDELIDRLFDCMSGDR